MARKRPHPSALKLELLHLASNLNSGAIFQLRWLRSRLTWDAATRNGTTRAYRPAHSARCATRSSAPLCAAGALSSSCRVIGQRHPRWKRCQIDTPGAFAAAWPRCANTARPHSVQGPVYRERCPGIELSARAAAHRDLGDLGGLDGAITHGRIARQLLHRFFRATLAEDGVAAVEMRGGAIHDEEL